MPLSVPDHDQRESLGHVPARTSTANRVGILHGCWIMPSLFLLLFWGGVLIVFVALQSHTKGVQSIQRLELYLSSTLRLLFSEVQQPKSEMQWVLMVVGKSQQEIYLQEANKPASMSPLFPCWKAKPCQKVSWPLCMTLAFWIAFFKHASMPCNFLLTRAKLFSQKGSAKGFPCILQPASCAALGMSKWWCSFWFPFKHPQNTLPHLAFALDRALCTAQSLYCAMLQYQA